MQEGGFISSVLLSSGQAGRGPSAKIFPFPPPTPPHPRGKGEAIWQGFKRAWRSGGDEGGSAEKASRRRLQPGSRGASSLLPPFRAGPAGQAEGDGSFLRRRPRRGLGAAPPGRAGGGGAARAAGGEVGAGPAAVGVASSAPQPPLPRLPGRCGWGGKEAAAAGAGGRAERSGRGRESLLGRHGNGAVISNPRAVPVARCQGARVLQDSGNLPRPGTEQCAPSVSRTPRARGSRCSAGPGRPPPHVKPSRGRWAVGSR